MYNTYTHAQLANAKLESSEILDWAFSLRRMDDIVTYEHFSTKMSLVDIRYL